VRRRLELSFEALARIGAATDDHVDLLLCLPQRRELARACDEQA